MTTYIDPPSSNFGATGLGALLPAILDRAFKGEFNFKTFHQMTVRFVMKLSRSNRV